MSCGFLGKFYEKPPVKTVLIPVRANYFDTLRSVVEINCSDTFSLFLHIGGSLTSLKIDHKSIQSIYLIIITSSFKGTTWFYLSHEPLQIYQRIVT